jgi:hypothetical protein
MRMAASRSGIFLTAPSLVRGSICLHARLFCVGRRRPAVKRVLEHEPRSTVSRAALSRHARRAAAHRTASDRSAAARKAARTRAQRAG